MFNLLNLFFCCCLRCTQVQATVHLIMTLHHSVTGPRMPMMINQRTRISCEVRQHQALEQDPRLTTQEAVSLNWVSQKGTGNELCDDLTRLLIHSFLSLFIYSLLHQFTLSFFNSKSLIHSFIYLFEIRYFSSYALFELRARPRFFCSGHAHFDNWT